jgi:transglutaminase-like putative cysteine protease
MLIRIGYDIQFDIPASAPMVTLLHIHPSREKDLIEPDALQIEPQVDATEYIDGFGNRCTRFVAPHGSLRLHNSTLIRDTGLEDQINIHAREVPVGEVPAEFLCYLLSSRYCEVDRFSNIAYELFGHITPGWSRVQAICDWVHGKVTFSYPHARPTKSALDVYTERIGVCRDFQHLAITFCRAMNIPARYATGYLGDIAWPVSGPMDFSAWFEVYLENCWRTFDARNNKPRIGRVLMAVGRDASDVAITTSFGHANLSHFTVITDEVTEGATNAPIVNAPAVESAAD